MKLIAETLDNVLLGFDIMVWTRGLSRALGHVTGKGVGRRDRDDSDDAPQRRRPTASARRQRVVVTVAHDELVVLAPDVEADVFPDDPMAPADSEDIVADIPADTGAEAAEDEHEGFSGGPSDPSVLTQYADHIACSVWTGEVHSLGRPVPAIEGLVAGTGLSPLIACSVDTGDWGLLSSFVERWHRETSSFHLSVGELTITLDDVSSLLHLPVVGDLHAFQPLHVDDVVQMLVDLLMVSAESAMAETAQCRGPYVHLQWVRDIYKRRCQAGHWTATARAYLFHLLGCTLFSNKSATNVHVVYLEALRDLSQTGREHQPVRDFHVISCYSGLLRWGPVVVYYRLERVVRQFGYTQTIPAPPVDSWVSYDDIHNKRMHYSDHIVSAGEVCTVPGQCASDYMDWFFHILHPFMTPSHASDPLPDGHALQPRVVPQAPQTDISHVSEPGAPSTSVEEPRHAVEVCDEIAERLECHLSLGVVTPGSSTHEVIEECLRMARSVTQDHLVYVRSRRRWRTDQA
ncbi:Protein MAIN-LIKE 1 [Glycine max]|nr:Protein MAIN-LIKE 1 [Glycine max]